MLSIPEQKTFGVDAQLHRITGKPIEQGSGALHPDAQAIAHWGQMTYELAVLSDCRREYKDKLSNETATLVNMGATHAALSAPKEGALGIDITGRQNSLHKLAAQDLQVANLKKQCAALDAEHEALAVQIAEVHAKLTEEGMFDKFGTGPAATWFGAIRDKGWSIPS
jgi:hypothetical protein